MAARCVQLAGATIELTATIPAATRQLRRFFGPLPSSDRWADVHVRLMLDDITAPNVGPDSVDGPIQRWEDGSNVWLRHVDGLGASVTADAITIGGWDPEAWRPMRQLLSSALAAWFGRRGVALAHGALIEHDGDGVVVLGPSGSGKSTVALGALAARWRVHSDDLVLLAYRSDGTLVAHGIPKVMTVDGTLVSGNDLSRLDLKTTLLDDDHRGRSTLPASTLHHAQLPVRAMIVVGHAEGDGSLGRLSEADRLAAAVSSAFEATRPAGLRDSLFVLAPLGAVAGFRLGLAADAERRVDRAAALLRELAAELAREDHQSTHRARKRIDRAPGSRGQ